MHPPSLYFADRKMGDLRRKPLFQVGLQPTFFSRNY
jgi:hypothetical protein